MVLKEDGVLRTCGKHNLRLDHLYRVGAKFLKIRDALGVTEPADVDVRNLEADGKFVGGGSGFRLCGGMIHLRYDFLLMAAG